MAYDRLIVVYAEAVTDWPEDVPNPTLRGLHPYARPRGVTVHPVHGHAAAETHDQIMGDHAQRRLITALIAPASSSSLCQSGRSFTIAL
jgi:hypothetical protein